jgi:hypothetical protein
MHTLCYIANMVDINCGGLELGNPNIRACIYYSRHNTDADVARSILQHAHNNSMSVPVNEDFSRFSRKQFEYNSKHNDIIVLVGVFPQNKRFIKALYKREVVIINNTPEAFEPITETAAMLQQRSTSFKVAYTADSNKKLTRIVSNQFVSVNTRAWCANVVRAVESERRGVACMCMRYTIAELCMLSWHDVETNIKACSALLDLNAVYNRTE